VALAGRRIDAVEAPARFPLRFRRGVAALIREALIDTGAQLLISSAACGADLLGLEAAGALGIRRRVVLPFDVMSFRTHSVVDRPGGWGPLFDRIISEVERAGDLVQLELNAAIQSAYQQANRVILSEGEALFAQRDAAARIAVIVWEGQSHGAGDLTEDFRVESIGRGWSTREILTNADAP
jgi:hypothetical protein